MRPLPLKVHQVSRPARVRVGCDAVVKTSFRPKTHFLCVTDEHLSLALARNVVFGINRILSAKSLYATTKFNLEWVLSEIRLKYGKLPRYFVLGDSDATLQAAKKVSLPPPLPRPSHQAIRWGGSILVFETHPI